MSTVVDEATGSYVSPNSTGRSCFPCFPAFDIVPPPSTLTQPELYDMATGLVPELQLNGLADLRDGCTCVGFFPLPDLVCPFETSTVADGTRYKLCGSQPVCRVHPIIIFTKSTLGDDAAILARSSGEEPASPRHRARRFSKNAP